MRAFASFVLRGRVQAVLVITVAAALSLILPLLGHVSGGTVALVTLRKGLGEGLVVSGLAALVLAIVGYFSALDPRLVNVFLGATLLVIWLPVMVTGQVLRMTRSMSAALAVAGALGAAGLLLVYLFVGDVSAWWQEVLQTFLVPMLQDANSPLLSGEVDRIIENMSQVMTGIMSATLVFATMINLFIGRWLQAILYNPGGFRQEFLGLRLGRRMAVVALAVLFVSTFASGVMHDMAVDLLFLVGTIYSLQGLSLAHAVVDMTRAHVGWLVALYVLMLFLLAQAMLVLSAAGFADSWLDFRARLKNGNGPPARKDED